MQNSIIHTGGKTIFTVFQVVLYHISCHKWEILAYGLLLAETIVFGTSLLSDDVGAYSSIMTILAFSAIASAVNLEISEQ